MLVKRSLATSLSTRLSFAAGVPGLGLYINEKELINFISLTKLIVF